MSKSILQKAMGGGKAASRLVYKAIQTGDGATLSLAMTDPERDFKSRLALWVDVDHCGLASCGLTLRQAEALRDHLIAITAKEANNGK